MLQDTGTFRADHVGSLLRPLDLKEARARYQAGTIDAAALKAVEDRAIEAVEFDTGRAGGFEPLRLVPKGKTVVLGLVTSKTGEPESKEAIKRRIVDAARYLNIDQLCLSPQCGFASTEEGNLLTEEQQWAKLARIVEIADEVWG